MINLAILTQDDCFFIPRNIEQIISLNGVNVTLIAVLDTQGSLMNKKNYFVRGYGLYQSFKMGFLLYQRKLENLLDSFFDYKIFKSKRSIRAVAERYNIPFQIVDNPNNGDFINQLNKYSPDLIVSFSAPCAFGVSLLSLPERGCINLHCSRLPYYAGLMPNFWVLFNQEAKAGATVHFMDETIDGGKILSQGEFDISHEMSMFDLIRRTKRLGGQLIVETINALMNGSVSLKENNSNQEFYCSWPTIKDMRQFRKNGGKFI